MQLCLIGREALRFLANNQTAQAGLYPPTDMIESTLIYVGLSALSYVFERLPCVYELGVPNQRACGALATPVKARPWNSEGFSLCAWPTCVVCVHNFKYLVAFFRVSQPGASVWLPAALWQPQKRYSRGMLEHVPFGFCQFACVFQ